MNCTFSKPTGSGQDINLCIEQTIGDIFMTKLPIVHCISADAAMSEGIAPLICKYYSVRHFLPARLQVSTVYVTQCPKTQRRVYNVVTKTTKASKPTLDHFILALRALDRAAKLFNDTELHMPYLGTGRDKIPVGVFMDALRENVSVKVVLFKPRIFSHWTNRVIYGPRIEYPDFYELMNGCYTCGKQLCQCLSWNTRNVSMYNQLVSGINNYYRPNAKNEYLQFLREIELQCDREHVVAISGLHPFEKPKILYQGDFFVHKTRDLHIHFSHGREAFAFLMGNPWILFKCFYVKSYDSLKAKKSLTRTISSSSTSTETTSECSSTTTTSEESISLLKPVHNPRIIRKKDTRIYKKENFQNLARGAGGPRRMKDWDRQKYQQELTTQLSLVPSQCQAPHTMKIQFAATVISSFPKLSMKPSIFPLNKVSRLSLRELEMEKVLNLADPLNLMLYQLYQRLILTKSWKESSMHLHTQWKTLGMHKTRKYWHQLSLLSKQKKMPCPLQAISNLDIELPRFTRLQPFDRIEKMDGKATSLLKFKNDRTLMNFIKYVVLFEDFKQSVRKSLGYKSTRVQFSSSKLISLYLSTLTTKFIKCCGKFDDVMGAASNFAKVDVTKLNHAVDEGLRLVRDSQVTLDNIRQATDGLDLTKIKGLVNRIDSTMNTCDNFLNFLTSPMLEQAFEWLGSTLHIPEYILNQVKKRFTPVNVASITWLFISYQHTDSLVLKILYVLSMLWKLDILSSSATVVKNFCTGFLRWWQDDSETVVHTNLTSSLYSVITAIISGGSSLLQALISGFCFVLKGAMVTPVIMRQLLAYTGRLGRDLTFSFAGISNSSKLLETLIGAWKTSVAWCFGTKTPEDPAREWKQKFDIWKVKLAAAESPAVRDVLRGCEEARKNIDELYEDGIELMHVPTLHPELRESLRLEVCELGRLMKRAKDVADLVASYRSFAARRITPYTLTIQGETGIGKTNMIHTIANKFHEVLWSTKDRSSILYNVPLDSEFYDGLTDQEIVVVDDFNALQDPERIIRLISLTSNVPTVANMSHLDDKGLCFKFQMLIKTTNNRDSMPNGITSTEAIARRDNHYIIVSVDPAFKQGGKVSKELIIKDKIAKLKAAGTTCVPGLTLEQTYAFYAEQYYQNQEYYQIHVKCPTTKTTIKAFNGVIPYVNWLIQDFANHRAKETELLEANQNLTIDTEELTRSKNVKKLIEEHRDTLEKQKEFISKYFSHPLPPQVDENLGALNVVLGHLSALTPEERDIILQDSSKYMYHTYNYTLSVLQESAMVKFFHQRIGGSFEYMIQRIASEAPPMPEPEPELIEMTNFVDEEPQPGPSGVGNFTHTMFSFLRNESNAPSVYGDADSDNELWYTIDQRTFDTRLYLDINRCLDLEYVNGEDLPPNGWSDVDLHMALRETNGGYAPGRTVTGRRGNVISAPPLNTLIATDFILRLKLECDNYHEVQAFMQGLTPDIVYPVNPRWFLAYRAGTEGVGFASFEANSEWMKQSAWAFASACLEDKLTVLSRSNTLERDYVNIATVIGDNWANVHTHRVRNESFWGSIWRGITATIVELIIVVFILCVYIALILALAWLVSPSKPNSTATKYQVDPRKQKYVKTPWTHTAGLANVVSSQTKFRDNFHVIGRVVNPSTGDMVCTQLTYIQGTYAITSMHLFPQGWLDSDTPCDLMVTTIEHDTTPCVPLRLEPRQVRRVGNGDCVMFNVPVAGRVNRSMLNHFSLLSDFGDSFNGMYVRMSSRSHTANELSHTNAKINGVTSTSLPFDPERQIATLIMDSPMLQGESGALVWSCDPSYPRSILGVLSGTTKRWSVATPLFREELEEALELLNALKFEDAEFDSEVCFDERQSVLNQYKIMNTQGSLIFEHAKVVGIQSPQNTPTVMSKTSFHKTPIADMLPDVSREPAILSDWDPRRKQFEGQPHFLHKSVNKYACDIVQCGDDSLLECLAEDVAQYFLDTREFDNVRRLNIEDAISAQGLNCSSLDLTTSPGLPWSLEKNKRSGKTTHITRDEQGTITFISENLKDEVNGFLKKCESGIVPFFLQNDFMKDELRDATAGKQNITRTVTVLPMHVTIAARMLLLDYYSRIHSLARRAYPVCVGINMESRSSELLLQKIWSLSGGMYCVDFDVRNWDGHWPYYLRDFIINVRTKVLKASGASHETCIALKALYWSIFHGYIQLGSFVTRKPRGMTSGSPGTAEDNSESHLGLVYTIFFLLASTQGLSFGFKEFIRLVRVFVYGDDIILAMDESIVEWFNGTTISSMYTSLGFPVTSAVKGEEIVEYKHWSELTFLKRKFVYDHKLSKVLVPLDLATIRSLFTWARGKSDEQMYSNFDDAFRFLVHHGEEVFEEHKDKISKALHTIQMPGLYIHYKNLLTAYLNNYDNVA